MSLLGAFRNPDPSIPLGGENVGIGFGYPPVLSGLGPASPVPYFDSPLMAAVTGSLVYPGVPATASTTPPPPPSLTSATGSTTGGTLVAGNYTYFVSAVGPWGETAASLAKVGNVASGAAGSVALVWVAVTGATSYRVYRYAGNMPSLIPVSEYPLAAVYLPGNVTTYTDTGANPPSYGSPFTDSPELSLADTTPILDVDLGITNSPRLLTIATSTSGGTGLAATTAYYYVVVAVNSAGQPLVGQFARAGGIGPVSEPSNELNITTGAGGTNSNSLTWAPVPEAVAYRVYRATASFTAGTANGLPASTVAYDVGNVTSWTDTGATIAAAPAAPGAVAGAAPFGGSQFGALGNAGTASDKGNGAGRAAAAQYYRVCAIIGTGGVAGGQGEGVLSTEVTATPAAGQAVTVSWSAVAVTGIIGYRVYIGTATGVYSAYVDVGLVTSFVDVGYSALTGPIPVRSRLTAEGFAGKAWAFLQTSGSVANGAAVATVGGIVFNNQTGVTVPTGKWLWAVQA